MVGMTHAVMIDSQSRDNAQLMNIQNSEVKGRLISRSAPRIAATSKFAMFVILYILQETHGGEFM